MSRAAAEEETNAIDAPNGNAPRSEGANGATVYSNASPTKSIRMLHAEEDEGDLSLLQEHMLKQSRTIDDFTRIIADWRSEKEQRQRGDGVSVRTSMYEDNAAGPSTTGHVGNSLRVRSSTLSLRSRDGDADTASQYSYDDQDDASPSRSPAASTSLGVNGDGPSSNAKVRCTCCCGKGTRRCKRARRATREWGEVESDLRLAAEIGQALLRRNDGLQSELNQAQQDYSTRIDSLMKKLSTSIKEAGHLEKQREQSELNFEATEASNRSLVRELDETRKEVMRLRSVNAKSSNMESRLEKALRDAADAKQELVEERKNVKKLEKAQRETNEQLKIARIESSSRGDINEEDRAKRREEMRAMVEARISSSSSGVVEASALAKEIDQLQEDTAQLRDMLATRDEEIAQLREELVDQESERHGLDHRDEMAPDSLSAELIEDGGKEEGSSSVRSASRSPSQKVKSGALSAQNTPQLPSTAFAAPGSVVGSREDAKQTPTFLQSEPPSKVPKETRTAQLLALIEAVQRIFGRLSSADVDTLSKRLQRQKLTGDVGHLARTTVNSILRDVEALREQFRKAIEAESRSRDVDNSSQKSGKSEKESESLIARKEFFALIKVFRELLVEIVRLRRAINEVSIQPQHAARILQEELGVNTSEDKGVGAWIGRLFTAVPLQGVTSTSTQMQGGTTSVPGRVPGRTPSGGQMTSRAIAAVVPSTVAVEVKGSHASEQSSSRSNFNIVPSHARPLQPDRQRSLSRMQSRNLSGLFVGSLSAGSDGSSTFNYAQSSNIHSRIVSEQGSNRYNRLSRIVDDDEVSIHQGFTPKRGLRPRNLSDSSIRTTYMEDEDRLPSTARQPTHAAVSRIITPSSLSLQASSTAQAGVVHSNTSASLLSDDDSASTVSKGTSPSMREVPSNTGFLSAIAPRTTMSKALSFLSGPSLSTTPVQPSLRSTSSSAKLSLAAASARNEAKVQSNKDDDAFQVGSSRAREMGF